MNKIFTTSLFVAIFAMVAACGVKQEKYDADIAALNAQLEQAQGEASSLQSKLSQMEKAKQELEAQLNALNASLQQLTGERDALAKAKELSQKRLATFKNMLAKFKAMIESGKIKIRIRNNKMIVEMESAILFKSGKSTLSDEGETAIAEVGAILATLSGRNFQVAGHTDNVPIKNRRFKNNWDLSSARAVTVVRNLVEAGMKKENLSAAGYADTQPVADNSTEEGRAQNRRIEIVLQPALDELPDLSSLEGMLK